MPNTTILINFGHKVFNKFLELYEPEDRFYLAIDNTLFNECLGKINRKNLLTALNELNFKYPSEGVNSTEQKYISLSTAAYQVLLTWCSKTQKENIPDDIYPNTKIKNPCNNYYIWKDVRDLFLTEKLYVYFEQQNEKNKYYSHQLFFFSATTLENKLKTSKGTYLYEQYKNDFNVEKINENNINNIFTHIKLIADRSNVIHRKKENSNNITSNIITIQEVNDIIIFCIYDNDSVLIENFTLSDEDFKLKFEKYIGPYFSDKHFLYFVYMSEQGDYLLTLSMRTFKDNIFFVISDEYKESLTPYFINNIYSSYNIYKFDFTSTDNNLENLNKQLKETLKYKNENSRYLGGIKINYKTYLEGCEPDCFSNGTLILKNELSNAIKSNAINLIEYTRKNEIDFPRLLINNNDEDYISGLYCNLSEIENEFTNTNSNLAFCDLENKIWKEYKNSNQYYLKLQEILDTISDQEIKELKSIKNTKWLCASGSELISNSDIIKGIYKQINKNKINSITSLIANLHLTNDLEKHTKENIIPYLLCNNKIIKKYVINKNSNFERILNFKEQIHEEFATSEFYFWNKLSNLKNNAKAKNKYTLLEEIKNGK